MKNTSSKTGALGGSKTSGPQLNRRDLMKIGGASAMLAFLSSCSGGSAATGGNGETLSFTSWTFTGRTVGPIHKAADLFTDATGVRISEKVYPYSQYLNQLVLSARGGRMTGIVHIDEEWMSTLATAGVIESLDSIVEESRYPSVVRDAGTYQSVRYGMPWTQSAIGLVANEQLLQDVGVDTSSVRTIDDFTAMLRHIQEADSSLIPYAPCTDVTQLKDFIPWVWAFGGDIYDGNEVTLGDEASRQALDYWKMLLDEGLIQPGVDREAARTLFAQGRTPIYDDAPQAIGVVPSQSSDPDIASKMGPLTRPSVDGQGTNLVWSQPLVALDDARSTAEALQFFGTDPEALEAVFEGLGNPPTTSEALEASWFTEVEFHAQWASQIMVNARRNPLWEFPIATSAQRAHDEAIERGLRGSVTTAQALAEGREALTELLHV